MADKKFSGPFQLVLISFDVCARTISRIEANLQKKPEIQWHVLRILFALDQYNQTETTLYRD